MFWIVAARTLNLILRDPAARAKQDKIVVCQLSNVHRSTGAPLFCSVLREQQHREVSDYEFAFGRQASDPSIY
jgi:hypothetical protein